MKEIQTEQTKEITISDISWDDIINSIDTEELTDKDAEALSYLLTGYSIPESSTLANMSDSTLRRHIKENKILQDALGNKKKMMMALMLNKFQKQMMQALDVSSEFLLEDPAYSELGKSQTSIYLKKVTHAEWVIDRFFKLMNSNPLEGLSIIKDGEGDMNIILNVEGISALDYLTQGMTGKAPIATANQQPQTVSNVPLLDERGLPPYGVFGSWAYDEDGGIVCHVCGKVLKSKQAFYGHISVHNINADLYAEVYNVLFDELI